MCAKLNLYRFLLVLFLCSNNVLFAQVVEGNLRIETYGNKEGFLQNTVSAITSDKNGYLWFATPNGLISYDGYSFENHNHDPENPASIPNNFIKNLLNDSNGKLWIGTLNGLCLYFPDEERFEPLTYDISGEEFIKEDLQERIWIGKQTTLNIFESKIGETRNISKIGEIDLSEALQNDLISDLYFISDSELLVATSSKIYKVKIKETVNYTFEVLPLQFDFEYNGITKLIKVNNSWWIGTEKGLFHAFLEGNKLITLKSYFNKSKKDIDTEYQIVELYLDRENTLWVGTNNHGMFQYNDENENFTAYTRNFKSDNGISSNRINAFFEDEYKVLWIGTVQGGLNKLDKNQKPFRNYQHNPFDEQSISGNLITDITEDRDGKIWLTFFRSAICQVEGSTSFKQIKNINFKRLKNKLKALENEIVLSLFEDHKGYLWIGTESSIYLYDKLNDKLKKVQVSKNDNNIETKRNWRIKQTDDHHILIGGSKVLLLKDPWQNILSNKPIVLKNDALDLGYVNDIVKAENNSYWFAARTGLYQVGIQEGEFKIKLHLSTTSNKDNLRLSHDNIFSIHIDKKRKNIWLGSFGGGFMKIKLNPNGDPENIKSYQRKDGLADDAVYGIIEDNQGFLWLSTDRGICQFDPKTEVFDVYNVNDGLSSENYRQSAYLKTKSGFIFMGGVNGLTVFNPEEIKKNLIPPKIILSHLKIDNQLITAKKLYKNKLILEKSISETKKLVLEYQNRNISLDVLVQHSSAPKKNSVSYMLEGVNEDWIKSEKGKITATYTNLNPGTYKFLYKGTNGDGVWTTNTNELIIQVLAPWYLKWWSLLMFGVFMLFIIYQFFRYSVSQEKLKQKLNFEKLEKERIHEMDEAKLRFFTNISHDFKTPLSLIIGPFEKIAEHNTNKEDSKYFSIIKNNIARLQRMIDQLTSYRKAETGHLKLNYSKVTIGDFAYPLMEAFEENAKQNNINFYYKINLPNKAVTIDIDKTERIILNLYSNAVKYSRLNSNISFIANIIVDDGYENLYFEIADTGIGISPEKLNKIFDRFYRGVDDDGEWSGTGVGLALSKTLIDLMGGSINVESTPNEKTIFRITVPINKKLNGVENLDVNKREFINEWMPVNSEETHDNTDVSNLPTILVIDDEEEIRLFFREAFKKKYKVILATDGEDGLEKLEKYKPKLIISDVMMPKLDGYQVCEKIKSNPETSHIPVILLSALSSQTKRLEGLELGADDYIAKPFSIKHLEIRVKQLIESRQRIIDYFSKSSILPKKDMQLKDADRNFLTKVNGSMEKNMEQSSFGVEELAKDIGMSTSHFYRKLKQLTGQVPNEYLRNFRLQKAAKIMKENKGLTANQVMYKIGIESPSYFSTSFKKLYGVTPSEFIKNPKRLIRD